MSTDTTAATTHRSAHETKSVPALDVSTSKEGPTDVTALPPPATATQEPASMRFRLLEHLRAEVDPNKATFPLIWYCFMTGYVSSSAVSEPRKH